MCFLFQVSKFISIPIVYEWLNENDVISLDSALVNHKSRQVFKSLLQEYGELISTRIYSRSSITLLELCGWDRLLHITQIVSCPVSVSRYDLVKITRFPTMSTKSFAVRIVTLTIDHTLNGMDSDSLRLLSGMVNLRMLMIHASSLCLDCFVDCHKLTNIHIGSGVRGKGDVGHSLANLIRVNPLLISITLPEWCFSGRVAAALALHSHNLLELNCELVHFIKPATMFLLHSRTVHLKIFKFASVFESPLLAHVLLWNKRHSLTHLRMDANMQHALTFYNPSESLLSVLPCLQTIETELPIHVSDTSLVQSVAVHEYRPPPGVDDYCTSFVNLRELHMFECGATNEQLMRIVKSCPLLTHIALNNIRGHNIGFLGLIAPYCSNVTHLTLPALAPISQRDIPAFVCFFQKLVEITLFLSCAADTTVCLTLLKIDTLKSLRVQVNGPDNFAKNSKIVDPLLCGMSNVSLLHMSFVQFDDQQLYKIISHCPGLTDLQLRRNDFLTSQGFIALAPHCRNIQSLQLQQCKRLDDTIVESVMNCCPRLHTFDSGMALDKIANGCLNQYTCVLDEWD